MRRLPLLLTLLCSSCGASESAPPHPPPAVTSAAASAAVRPLPPERRLPARVDDVLAGVPKDASVVVHLPSATTPGGLVEAAGIAPVIELIAAEAGVKAGLEPETMKALLRSFDGGALFGRGALGSGEPRVGAVLRFTDGAPLEALLGKLGFKREGAGPSVLDWKRGDDRVTWLPAPKVAIVGRRASDVEAALDALGGVAPSFSASPLASKHDPGGLWVGVDLAAAAPDPGSRGPGSRVLAGVGAASPFSLSWSQYGAEVPRLGAALVPGAHTLVGALPSGAVAALGLSLERAAGKTLRDLVSELGRSLGADLAKDLGRELEGAGTSLADLDAALGSEAALGFYAAPGASAAKGKLGDHVALIGALGSRDDKRAERLLAIVAKALKSGKKGVTATASKLSLPLASGGVLQLELQKGRVVLGVGAKKPVEKALAALAKGKDLLGAAPGFVEARKEMAAKSNLLVWSDTAALAALVGEPAAKGAKPGLLELTLPASAEGLELVLRSSSGGAGVSALGAASALLVYSVRRYVAATKTAEAKNAVGAMSRGALAAFEAERLDAKGKPEHRLCDSSTAVPAAVPKGTLVSPGSDFETGSPTAGWKCLRVQFTTPLRYQLAYRKGSGYKGPKRGGPDPGKDGFEVSAEGDLDGNGKTSLFTMIGKVDKKGNVALSQLFVVDELE